MSKIASHEPFGHLQHKLWSKEGPGVKLTFWLLATKIRESTWSRCVQVKCDTPLESSWGELQLCFRPHSNRRLGREVMNVQSFESQFRDSTLGVPGKSAIWMQVRQRVTRKYYMGEGGGFPRIRAVVSQVSPSCPWLVPTPRVYRMWANPLDGWFWMQDHVTK